MAGGAALGALAPTASAAPEASSSHVSSSSGSAANVTIGGNTVQLAKAAAYPGSSPKSASIGTSQLLPVLQGVPVIGQALASAVQTANPGGTDVVTVSAVANSDGKSNAAATLLGGDPGGGTAHALKINLSLADLGVTNLTGALSGISDLSLLITLNGPTATCSAGPNGTGMSAQNTPLDATAVLESGGKPVGQPIALHGGEIFDQLSGLGLPAITSGASLGLSVSGGSRNVSNGVAQATAANVGLSSGGSTLLNIQGAHVTCGPNSASGGTGPGGTGPGGTGPGGTGTGTGVGTGTGPSSNGETPLTGVQTDEGTSSQQPRAPWLLADSQK